MAILPLQLARVSNTLRSSVANSQLSRTQQQLLEVQNQLSSGKRLSLASDDPGAAAIVQQLKKTLQQRDAYSQNLRHAQSQLGEVDSTLSDVTDLLQQAQNIASANVGSTVTDAERQGAAAVISSIQQQMLTLANKQFDGVYIFGGDKSNQSPFANVGNAIKFVGSTTVLQNRYDENSLRPFMIDGGQVFGALSSRVQGSADLTPSISADTRLSDLRGAAGQGVRLGSLRLSNGTQSAVVNLSGADSLGDVVDKLNSSGLAGITASLSGGGITLSAGAAVNIAVSDISGGTTAADLGILQPGGGGVGAAIVGADLLPRITPLTPLAQLRGGAGIDTSGLTLGNGTLSATVDLSGAVTVEDLLNRINSAATNVQASINAAGTGINIVNPTQGTSMTIGENGGSTAVELGVRSFTGASPLSELNFGKGVRSVAGADFVIHSAGGTEYTVSIAGAAKVSDVLAAINTATGGAVTANLASTGNGIELTDTTTGTDALSVRSINFSSAAADLGLDEPAAGNRIGGRDVDPVKPEGVFANLQSLYDGLMKNDATTITAAAGGLQNDYQRVVSQRGQAGAQVQEMESRQSRLEDENLATRGLMSGLEDTDFTEAVSRFQTLQTALQAGLQTSGRMLQLSLLDFLR